MKKKKKKSAKKKGPAKKPAAKKKAKPVKKSAAKAKGEVTSKQVLAKLKKKTGSTTLEVAELHGCSVSTARRLLEELYADSKVSYERPFGEGRGRGRRIGYFKL